MNARRYQVAIAEECGCAFIRIYICVYFYGLSESIMTLFIFLYDYYNIYI